MPYLMNNTGFIYTLETALKILLEFKVIIIGEEHLSRGLPPPGGTRQSKGLRS